MDVALSFEFFPPRADGAEAKLDVVSQKLARMDPDFFSVTFGAGGSTQSLTKETVLRVADKTGHKTAPHISCVALDKHKIRATLADYQSLGIDTIVALRGDVPSGAYHTSDFRYANELVADIRSQTGDFFTIFVAAYPETHSQAASFRSDLDNFKRKIDAGANGAITQYFYNVDAYYQFVEECSRKGVNIPITPGVMPITNYARLLRFSNNCGVEIPRWIQKRLDYYSEDKTSMLAFGVDVVTQLCSRLLEYGAPGLHFYTMNKAEPVLTILRNLDIA